MPLCVRKLNAPLRKWLARIRTLTALNSPNCGGSTGRYVQSLINPDGCYILNNISQKAYTLQGQGKSAIVTLDYTAKQESDECTVGDPQLAAKRTGIQDLRLKYRTLRNRITHKLGRAKHEYYTDLFTEINDCKPYWQLVQNAAGGRPAQPILEASEERMAGLKHRTRIKRKFSTRISQPLGRSSPMKSHRSVKRIVSPISLVSHQRL